MMTYNNILINIHEHILTITVNRPDKLNALNAQTIQEIGDAVKRGEDNKEIAGIIITGSGTKAFIAGADISEFSKYSVEEGKALSAAGHKVFKSIELCKKPVIAAVNGFALGGGCELAKFGQPEVKLGLIPGYAGTQRLVQLIGKGKALELLMTADMIGAEEAHRLGLVNYVTTPDQLFVKVNELLSKIKANGPNAVGSIIRCVDAYFADGVDGSQFEIDEFGKCFKTDDFNEGVAAFLEKRKADFVRG